MGVDFPCIWFDLPLRLDLCMWLQISNWFTMTTRKLRDSYCKKKPQKKPTTTKNKQTGSCLHSAVSIQHDVSFLFCQILSDVVGDGVGLQHEPALRPVLPLVTFLHHVALQREMNQGNINQQLLEYDWVLLWNFNLQAGFSVWW